MKNSKVYDLNTVSGMEKAEKAYIRFCNNYYIVEKVFLENYTKVYFKYDNKF